MIDFLVGTVLRAATRGKEYVGFMLTRPELVDGRLGAEIEPLARTTRRRLCCAHGAERRGGRGART